MGKGRHMDVSIILPLFNQLVYTKICLESLISTVDKEAKILLINNGSTDGTGEFLRTCKGIAVIENKDNLGCAGAWNQGVRATDSEWVLILNNDVILSTGWLESLLKFAVEGNYDIVSPAFREGEHNYDMDNYAREFVRRMGNVARRGVAEGICFMVRRRVFDTIGLFDENFRIGQYEDADFFRRASKAGFHLGITGCSFIHHYGSVTQKALNNKNGAKPYEAENRAYFRRKWGLNRWRLLREQQMNKWRALFWRTTERVRYGHTLKEKWLDGKLRYY